MGIISDLTGGTMDIGKLNPRDPDYIQQVQAITAKFSSGEMVNTPSSIQPTPSLKPNFKPTEFEDEEGEEAATIPHENDTKPENKFSRKVKFIDDESGEEVEEELDLSEDEKAAEIAKRLRRMAAVEEELKALREENLGFRKGNSQRDEKLKKYSELETKSKREKLDVLLSDAGGYEALRQEIIKEYEEYMDLTPEERQHREDQKAVAEQIKRMAELEKKLAEKDKESENRRMSAERAEKVATLKAVYTKYTIDNPESDPDIADINNLIFTRAQNSIAELEKNGVTVTETILNREFKKASTGLKTKVQAGPKTAAAGKEKIKQVADQLDANMAAAQGLQTNSNAGGKQSDGEVMERWRGYLKANQAWKITDEVSKSPGLTKTYRAFANRISTDRSWMNR